MAFWSVLLGTISFALFWSLFDGCNVKGAKKIKKKKTAVTVLFTLWLIFHMLKISTTFRNCMDTFSHLVKY